MSAKSQRAKTEKLLARAVQVQAAWSRVIEEMGENAYTAALARWLAVDRMSAYQAVYRAYHDIKQRAEAESER